LDVVGRTANQNREVTRFRAPITFLDVIKRQSSAIQFECYAHEWIIERKVQLLIDKGEIQNARQLLLSVPFQKVHQTYTRTGMWLQICEKLREPCDPIPQVLGEDRLARFGAYREFQ